MLFNSMKASEERFMDIIRKDNVQFKIPIYQRIYDWRTETLPKLCLTTFYNF